MAKLAWLLPGLAVVGATRDAVADHWLTAEVPAATAVSGPQEQAFRAGAMPALGLYQGTGLVTLGVRVRAGVLRDGATPPGHMADPGTGGLVTGGLALRLGVRHWAEIVAGGGFTGHDAVPAIEAGVGWSFHAGAFAVGPSVRYLRVVASAADALGTANLVLVGVDFQLGREPRAIAVPPRVTIEVVAEREPPAPPIAPAPTPVPPIAIDRDDDRVVDRAISCRDLLEANDQASGCEAITVIGDRIILDDRVLFDTDHARVRSAGRAIIRGIARAWSAHPEWASIRIEGHTDLRGDEAYNQALSERRADRARAVLTAAGVPEDHVTSVGLGSSQPRARGASPEAHRQNRRVEFVIERRGQ